MINSTIVKGGTPQLTPADGAGADNRIFYGIVKKGAGTLELNNAVDMVGTVTMNEGTLRLGEKASGTLGAVVVTGESSVDVVQGATMSFDDSSALAWAEGATLNLTGEIGKKSIRFGTDANGLTAAQLAAILVNGKANRATIDEDGYLSVPKGFTLILK